MKVLKVSPKELLPDDVQWRLRLEAADYVESVGNTGQSGRMKARIRAEMEDRSRESRAA